MTSPPPAERDGPTREQCIEWLTAVRDTTFAHFARDHAIIEACIYEIQEHSK